MNTVKSTGSVLWWSVVAFVIFAAMSFGWLVIKPYYVEKEREVTKNSPQWIESRQAQLQSDMITYQTAETDIAKYEAADPVKYADVIADLRSQQQATLVAMHSIADDLKAKDIPYSVAVFLEKHPLHN